MKSKLDTEILGTINYIKNILRDIEDRVRRGEINSGFLYHSKHWLDDAYKKLERLTQDTNITEAEF